MSEMSNPFEGDIDRIVDEFCSTWLITIKLTMVSASHEKDSLEWRLLQFQSSIEALKIDLKINILNKYKRELESIISKLTGGPGNHIPGKPGIWEK